MIYLLRFLWVIFYVPVFIVELIMFCLFIATRPIVALFYFIKNGDLESVPDNLLMPMLWIDEKYKSLLDVIEDIRKLVE